MNSCCTVFHINDEELSQIDISELNRDVCEECSCHCGYIQFESLAPYMSKLSNSYTQDDDHIMLEAKVRQEILQISRLFDSLTNVEPGFYSKAHTKVIKIYANGSRYLKIPKFVKNSVELYTSSGYLINPNTYDYIDGYLVLNPCQQHTSSCGCTDYCGVYTNKVDNIGWRGCYYVKAKFGEECADYAVQLAVKDYLIEHLTFSDIKQQIKEGITVARSFKVPDSWSSLLREYNNRRNFQNQFYFA